MLNLTDKQEESLRSAAGTWTGYITDPWRHDNIDIDTDYQKNCDEQDEGLLIELVRGIIRQHPELAEKEEKIKEWILEF
jgi:hypothetical protein